MVTSVWSDKGRQLVFLLEKEQVSHNLEGKRQLNESTAIFRAFANQVYLEVQFK